MAILHSLPGVEVTVWSNGSKLAEYDDFDDEVPPKWTHKTVSKNIQSETDAEFYFKFRVGEPYEHDCDELGFFIILDGCEASADGHLCGRVNLAEDYEWKLKVQGLEIQDGKRTRLKKFRFSKVHKTDYDDNCLTKEQVKGLEKIGQIEVRVHQLSHGKSMKAPRRELKDTLNAVPEKALKGRAISHNISYGKEEALAEASKYTESVFMHGWDGPLGFFRYKYRSRDDLQNDLIIPRSPTPEPPGPPSAAALTADQKLRLARMRYDDLEMLRFLIVAHNTNASKSSISPQRCFEDLTEEDINLFALQKYAEMTGVSPIKPEPLLIIKEEPSRVTATAPKPSSSRRRLCKENPPAVRHYTIDLTHDDNEPDSLFVTTKRTSTPTPAQNPPSQPRSRSISTPQLPTPNPPRQERHVTPSDDDDDDEIVTAHMKRRKRPKTRGAARPSVARRETLRPRRGRSKGYH